MRDLHAAAEPSPAEASYAAEWALFEDYCTATGQPALPSTPAVLAGFFSAVPAGPATRRRRLRAIASVHQQAGWDVTRLRPDLPPAECRHPRALSDPVAGRSGELDQKFDVGVIGGCPSRGWPRGFTGRRDAYLVVLIDVLGHTHDRARRLTPADVTVGGDGLRIDGDAVPASSDPRTCPTCAVVRWLEVCDLVDDLGRAIAREILTAASTPALTSAHVHRPGHRRWEGVPWLASSIDRHGRLNETEPLSARSMRTRLALARAASSSSAPDPPPERRSTRAAGRVVTDPPHA